MTKRYATYDKNYTTYKKFLNKIWHKFLQLLAALFNRIIKMASVKGAMPRQWPLIPDGSSWILPLLVPPSSAACSFFPQIYITFFHFPPFWLMLLLLLRKKLSSSFAASFKSSNLIFGFVNIGFSDIFCFVCARSLTKPFFRLSQPGSSAWLSPFLLCADSTYVLVCVRLCMCMWKCVGEVTNI